MKAIGSILVVLGVLAVIAGIAMKANWNQGAAIRTRAAFNALHGHAQLQIDDLEIQNATTQNEIDRGQGRRNNGLALQRALDQRRADEAFAQEADAAEAAQPSENVLGEVLSIGGGILAIIVGGILQSRRPPIAVPA